MPRSMKGQISDDDRMQNRGRVSKLVPPGACGPLALFGAGRHQRNRITVPLQTNIFSSSTGLADRINVTQQIVEMVVIDWLCRCRDADGLPKTQARLEAVDRHKGEAPGSFGPVVDGGAIPRHPFDPDAPEVSVDIPIIVSTALDERTYRMTRYDLDEKGRRALTLRLGIIRTTSSHQTGRHSPPGSAVRRRWSPDLRQHRRTARRRPASSATPRHAPTAHRLYLPGSGRTAPWRQPLQRRPQPRVRKRCGGTLQPRKFQGMS